MMKGQTILKFVLVGESGVGKSCLLLRFVDDVFSASFTATIGIDFKVKVITLISNQEVEEKVKVQVWDTAGQERFRTITNAYYNGAEAILVAYDVTNRESFNRLEYWMDEIEKRSRLDPVRVVVANKTDAPPGERKVTQADGQTYANKRGYEYFETSSLTGKGVHEMFKSVAQKVFNKKGEAKSEETLVIKMESEKRVEKKDKSCC